jgi:predicted small metal-binding protein
MKTMTCKQLGGACDKAFQANSFDEIADMAKQHGKEMFQNSDAAHLQAMSAMQELMRKPDAMKEWFDTKKKEFDGVPED